MTRLVPPPLSPALAPALAGLLLGLGQAGRREIIPLPWWGGELTEEIGELGTDLVVVEATDLLPLTVCSVFLISVNPHDCGPTRVRT